MNRTKVAIVVCSVAVAAFAAYQYHRTQSASQQATNSLQAGITQTKNAIGQIDQEMERNQADLDQLYNGLTIDFAAKLAHFDVGANRPALEAFLKDPLNTTKGVIDQFQSSSGAAKSLQDAQYLEALGKGAETIGQLWGLFNPAMATSQEAESVLIKSLETHAILARQAELGDIRWKLEQQVFRLEGKDPQTTTDWDRIYKNLFGDPSAAHRAFLKAVAAAKANEQQLIAKALKDAASRGDASAFQIAQGLKIIDPDQAQANLQQTLGINPDFIAAMQATNIATGKCASTGEWIWCNYSASKYPDGRYIPAVGPCLGVDFLTPIGRNPDGTVISGGVLTSSVAACKGGPLQVSTGPAAGTESSEGATTAELAFTTGPTETETIYVKGTNGDTGIGIYSPPVDEGDMVYMARWLLTDHTGKQLIRDPCCANVFQAIDGTISSALSGPYSNQRHWVSPRGIAAGNYQLKFDGLYGMEPVPATVRQGYITWVKIPHAVLQVDWEPSLSVALTNSGCSVTILDASKKNIVMPPADRDDTFSKFPSWRYELKQGSYAITLANRRYQSSSNPETVPMYGYKPDDVTLTAGKVVHYKLPVGGFTVSNERKNITWDVVSPNGQGVLSGRIVNRDSKSVIVLYPGRYKLIWGDLMDMAVNKRYQGALDFSILESRIQTLVIPPK